MYPCRDLSVYICLMVGVTNVILTRVGAEVMVVLTGNEYAQDGDDGEEGLARDIVVMAGGGGDDNEVPRANPTI